MANLKRADAPSPELMNEWVDEFGEELATALSQFFVKEDLDPDRAKVQDSYWGWSSGRVVQVEVGQRDYGVAVDENSAFDLAVELVTQDLEQEPELFTQSWLEQHINTDALRDALYADEANNLRDELESEAVRRTEDVAERMGIDIDDFIDEDGDIKEDTLYRAVMDQIDDFVDTEISDRLRDPVGYLIDMLGEKDGMEQAIKIAGIDIDAAARDAVATDGIGHFLGSYDGNIYDLPGGGVYWRHN